jgi:hypothetical protein
MADMKAGQQLASVVCETRVVVVRAEDPTAELTCGGSPMVPVEDTPSAAGAIEPGHEGPTSLGKRYVDDGGTIEVLCTKAGAGRLAIDGRPLAIKAAKPLPSSD